MTTNYPDWIMSDEREAYLVDRVESLKAAIGILQLANKDLVKAVAHYKVKLQESESPAPDDPLRDSPMEPKGGVDQG